MPKKKKMTPEEQLKAFKALAHEAEADLDAKAFDGLLKGTRGTKPPTKEEAFQAKREGKAD